MATDRTLTKGTESKESLLYELLLDASIKALKEGKEGEVAPALLSSAINLLKVKPPKETEKIEELRMDIKSRIRNKDNEDGK